MCAFTTLLLLPLSDGNIKYRHEVVYANLTWCGSFMSFPDCALFGEAFYPLLVLNNQYRPYINLIENISTTFVRWYHVYLGVAVGST